MGSGYHPSSLDHQMRSVIEQLTSPQGQAYLAAMRNEIPATAKSELEATKAVSGGYLQNDIENYDKYGHQLLAQQNDQADILSRGAIANDYANLTGKGGELALKAQDLMRQVDPEYYANRSLLGANLEKAQAGLSDSVSPTARAEMERYLGRQGGQQSAGSQSNTVGNAMKFGQLGQQATNNLVQNINGVANAMGSLKSGADLFGIATGRAGLTGNVAQGQMNQANAPGAGAAGLNMASQFGQSLQNTRQNNDRIRAAGFRTTGDQIQQGASTVGSLASTGAMFGL